MNQINSIFQEKIDKIKQLNQVKKNNPDIKMMCENLMKEMLWSKPPETIEFFTIKKHLNEKPELKKKMISKLSREEHQLISEQQYA